MLPNVRYNGDFPVTHQVKPGESLSKIAQQYGFKEWKPIFVYNTTVHKVLGQNPNLVRSGDQLFIPRTRQGYEKLIRKLESLKSQVSGHMDQIRYQLEGEHDRHQSHRVMWDFAGNVLTLIGTVTLKAASAAKQAKLAGQMTGRGKVAAQYLADKAARDLSNELKKDLISKGLEKGAEFVDQDLGSATSMGFKTKKGVEAIRGVSMQPGKKLFQWELSAPKSILDISELLIDQLEVSKIADGILLALTGETTGDTYTNAQTNIRNAERNAKVMLEEKIRKYRNELSQVYAA